jgi:hypothetical protein
MEPAMPSPKHGSSHAAPTYRYLAVVIASYLALVTVLTAAPRVLHRSLQPSTWVRATAFADVEVSRYTVEQLTALVPSLPRVRNSNITKIIHQVTRSTLQRPARRSWRHQPRWSCPRFPACLVG